jgi:hypothetical protein
MFIQDAYQRGVQALCISLSIIDSHSIIESKISHGKQFPPLSSRVICSLESYSLTRLKYKARECSSLLPQQTLTNISLD